MEKTFKEIAGALKMLEKKKGGIRFLYITEEGILAIKDGETPLFWQYGKRGWEEAEAEIREKATLINGKYYSCVISGGAIVCKREI